MSAVRFHVLLITKLNIMTETIMKTAFIGLDYIVDIMQDGGKIAAAAGHAVDQNCVANANKAMEIARSKGWLNVLVKVGFSSGYQTQPKNSPLFGQLHTIAALNLNDAGTDFHSDLDVLENDLVIVKPRVSAFYGTSLDAALRANNIERLVIAGVSSEWAVQSTVRDAHDRDYKVYVVEDACAAHTQNAHDKSMETLSAISEVIKVSELASL